MKDLFSDFDDVAFEQMANNCCNLTIISFGKTLIIFSVDGRMVWILQVV